MPPVFYDPKKRERFLKERRSSSPEIPHASGARDDSTPSQETGGGSHPSAGSGCKVCEKNECSAYYIYKKQKLSLNNFSHAILRQLVDFELLLTGVKPDATRFYAISDDYASWSLLIPVGIYGSTVFYDAVHVVHLDSISAKVRVDELNEIFRERGVKTRCDFGWNVQNRYFVFIADKIVGKFLRHRSRWNADGSRYYYYFFSSKLGANGIKARLYHLLGKFFKLRGENLDKNLKFEIYGKLKKIREFFIDFGSRLLKLSESIGWTRSRKTEEIKKKEKERRLSFIFSELRRLLSDDEFAGLRAEVLLYAPWLAKIDRGFG